MDVMRHRLGCGKDRDVRAALAVMTLLFLIGGTSAAVDHNRVSRHRELDGDHRGRSGESIVPGEAAGSGSRAGNGRSSDTDDIYSVRCGRYRQCDLRSDWCDEALGRCMSCAEDCSPRRIGGDELAVRRCHQICSVYYRHIATTASSSSSSTTTTNPSNKQQDALNDQPNDSRRGLPTLVVPDWFTVTVAATLCLITAATLSLVLLVVHRYCYRHQPLQQQPTEHRQLSFVGSNDKRQTTCLRGVLVVEGLTDLHQQMSAADKTKSVFVRALSDTVVNDNGSTSSVALVTPLLGDSSSKNVSI